MEAMAAGTVEIELSKPDAVALLELLETSPSRWVDVIEQLREALES